MHCNRKYRRKHYVSGGDLTVAPVFCTNPCQCLSTLGERKRLSAFWSLRRTRTSLPARAFSDFRSSCLSKEFFNYLYLPWCEHAQLVVVAHSFQCLPKSACQVYFLPEEPYGRPVGMVGIIEHGQATEGACAPPPSHFGERRARCVTVSIFCHRSFSLAGRNHRLSLGWGCA